MAQTKKKSLPQEFVQILSNQTIDMDQPGTILRDFGIFLSYIGEGGVPASKNHALLHLSCLGELNSKLTRPIKIALKRPLQVSYPHINVLYVLAKTTGIINLLNAGKQKRLVLDDEVMQSWERLNPTECYFTLLDACLFRIDSRLLDEAGVLENYPVSGLNSVFIWIPKSANNQGVEELPWRVSLFYIAMAELLGFASVVSAEPESGKGWHIAKLSTTPFGSVMGKIIFNEAIYADGAERFRSIVKPFFPEWVNDLAVATPKFTGGLYTFKVVLQEFGMVTSQACWRRIALTGEMTLDTLSGAILDAFGFAYDHLYVFTYRDRRGVLTNACHYDMDEGPYANQVSVGELELKKGTVIDYVYDLGEKWCFNIIMEGHQEEYNKLLEYPRLLETHGEAPEQYPVYEELWFRTFWIPAYAGMTQMGARYHFLSFP
ncbi:MAG: hypothetical protein SFH39_06555 [Candidatus Magnetobacterium sp. LHC-1]